MSQRPGKHADRGKRGLWHALLVPLLAAVEAMPRQEKTPLWLIETVLADALHYLVKLRDEQIAAFCNYDILPYLRGRDPKRIKTRIYELPYHLVRTTRRYDSVSGLAEATWWTIARHKTFLLLLLHFDNHSWEVALQTSDMPQATPPDRWLKRALWPWPSKFVYLPPPGPISPWAATLWAQDAVAQISIWAIQERMSAFLKLDPTFKGKILPSAISSEVASEECRRVGENVLVALEDLRIFLKQYFEKYRQARDIGGDSILWHHVHFFRSAESYRAFRKYVARTVGGLVAKDRAKTPSLFLAVASNTGPYTRTKTNPTVSEAADEVGLKAWRLYKLIKQGELKAERLPASKLLTIPRRALDALKAEQRKKRDRQELVKYYAQKKCVSKDSARRWIERVEKRGETFKEIANRILASRQGPGRSFDP